MTEYVPLDPAFAEKVYREQIASDEQERRLENATTETLLQVLHDFREPTAARAVALQQLIPRLRDDPSLVQIVLDLFDDPDPELWRLAIYSYSVPDERIVERLHLMLDNPDPENWSEAAVALARMHDGRIKKRLLFWFEKGDLPYRYVALEAFRWSNDSDSRRAVFESWERGGRGEEDRVVLAGALLRFGDIRGVSFLETVARRADGILSVIAATSIREHNAALSLQLMQLILNQGNPMAQQFMVGQIWNLAEDLPHAFTADGIHEARAWVEQELQNLNNESI